MADLLWFALAAFLAWFWVDALRARERAIALCKRLCDERRLQLLDQTVALEALRPARDRDGRLRLRRRYRFEFTAAGNERRQGTVVMVGQRMETMEIPLDDGTHEYQG